MEDDQIVALYWSRSEEAILQTQKKYDSYCMGISGRILSNREDARECVNDTYLAAWNSIPPQRPAILSTFLGKLTRRISIDRWRAQTADKRGGSTVTVALEELEATIPALSTVESAYDARELTRYLNLFLKNQNREDRYLFMRRYWYGDRISVIAENLNITPHKASVRLFRLRQKLQEYLKKEGMIA